MRKYQDYIIIQGAGNSLQRLAGATIAVASNVTGLPAAMFADDEVTPITTLTTDLNGFYSFKAADGAYTGTVSSPQLPEPIPIKIVIGGDNPNVALGQLAGSDGAGLIGGGIAVVASIAALRLLSKARPSANALVSGYYASGDGGGGEYYMDATDTTSADNGGTVIVAADGARWKLVFKEWISIRQFGAQEVTECTAKIQAAINAASGTNAVQVRIPAGTWFISAPGLALKSGTVIVGDGKGVTFMSNLNTCSYFNGGGVVKTGVAIRDICFKMNFAADRAVDFTWVTRSEVSGCKFTRGPGSGPNLGYGVWGSANGAPGYDNHVEKNEFEFCYIGIYLEQTANAYKIIGNTIVNGDFGIYVSPGVSTTRVLHNRIEAMAVDLLNIQGDDTEVHFNYIESYAQPPTTGSLISIAVAANRTCVGDNYLSNVSGSGITNSSTSTTYVGQDKTRHTRAIHPTGTGGNVQAPTSAVTLTIDSNLVVANATSAAFSVTLPPANVLQGQTIEVIKKDISANAVTVVVQGGNTINGFSSHTLAAQHKYGRYRSDGISAWYLIGAN